MTVEYSYRLVESDYAQLQSYAELLNASFPQARPFTVEYLDWLYNKNPAGQAVGYDAWFGEQLAAHYVTVPVYLMLEGEVSKGLLSLNTATHEAHRGKGLFTELAKRTYAAAQEQGLSAVVGVANGNSAPGFIKKLAFSPICTLDAYIGMGNPAFSAAEALHQASSFRRHWTADELRWRIVNPRYPLSVVSAKNETQFLSHTGRMGFVAVAVRPRQVEYAPSPAAAANCLRPKVFLGKLPKNMAMGGAFFPLPEKLKPSPLQFIYRPLATKINQLRPDAMFFDFLDFDAF